MNYEAARRHMVASQVRTNDVTDLRIQTAMETTPREIFAPADMRDRVYAEREVEYAEGRWLLRARDFAKLADIAEIGADDIVLNAVCGSGYSTAVLAGLAEMVVGIESDAGLAKAAEENLASLDVSNAAVITGDPWEGAPKQGPFDVIFIDGVIARRPEKLLAQLKDGGRLAAILAEDGVPRGGVYRRSGEAVSFTPHFDAASRRVLPGFEKPKAFVF